MRPPDEVIRQVLDRSGYRQMLKMSDDEEDEERLANIEELITAAKQFHRGGYDAAPSPTFWKTSRWPATWTAGTRTRTACR